MYMLQEKMNSADVTHHLGKSLKTTVWHEFFFQGWQQADKTASFNLAFGQLASCK